MHSSMKFNAGRAIFIRNSDDDIRIKSALVPGSNSSGCFICCSAPTCCPMLSVLPCFDDAQYVKLKRESSKYVYIRENSIEWNEPSVIMKNGSCLGVDLCHYDIQDHVTVLYFDDPMFDRLSDQTRHCNECRTCLCGGAGERVIIDSPICFNLCLRASCPCPCVPICCPTDLCPCVLRYEIYLEDAQKGLYEIKKSRLESLRELNQLMSSRLSNKLVENFTTI